MKVAHLCTWIASLIFGSGCSFHSKPTVLEAVGPAPSGLTENSKASNQGYLVVYSAWSSFVDPGSVGHHSRYSVSADDGSFTKEIINHADRFDEGPIRLPLGPGSYHVTARSSHAGRVVVPVVIKKRETTSVYLDGSSPRGASNQELHAVKLPDGEIVGWSANAEPTTSN